MDCHIHSAYSLDARECGAGCPSQVVEAVRKKGLRGFIITDHLDYGHWDGYIIDFDKYFYEWQTVRAASPDLTIYIGLEVGYEKFYERETAKIISDLPLEYVINSVHYWHTPRGVDPFETYLDCVIASLDAPYEFSTIGHLGFLERYVNGALVYAEHRDKLDIIIDKAIARGVRFEQNTNASGHIRLPREDFLRRYRDMGGVKPVLGSDAHDSSSIGRHFNKAADMLSSIFDTNN